MQQSDVDMLTLTAYYMIMSTTTDKPYMDVNGGCYLFESKGDAEGFCKGLEDKKTAIKNSMNYRTLTLCSQLYKEGFTKIIVKKTKGNFHQVPIDVADTKRDYYNPECTRNLLMLKQTKKKKYLKALKDTVFLAPMLIETRLPGAYPTLYYSYAEFKNATRYFILFTDTTEFDNWKTKQMYNWKPMELNLAKFGRIRGDESILINPMTDKIILTHQQIKIAQG